MDACIAAGQARTGWLAAGVHPSQFRILDDSCMTDLHSIIMHVNPDLHELKWMRRGAKAI